MIFDRTELVISVSKAKFDEEADFEVRLSLNPQKPSKNIKKLFFRTEKIRHFFFSASKNETSGIVWNTFSQSFAPIGAILGG